MKKDILKERLLKIRGKTVDIWFKKFTEEELNFIMSEINFLDITKDSFAEIRFCFINELKERPKCLNCGCEVKYLPKEKRYLYFCSEKCRLSDAGILHYKKILKKNNMKEYGVENVFQLDTIKEKIKETNLEKYGVENPAKCEEIQNKIKETNLEKYGVEYGLQNREVKEKTKETNLEKYGVENVFQNDNIKEKSKKTRKEKYGVEFYSSTDEYKDIIRIKNRNKYWNVFLIKLKQKQIIPLFSKEDYIKYDYNITEKEYLCLICNKKFKSKEIQPIRVYCNRHRYNSNYEREVENFIRTLNANIDINMNKIVCYNKKRYECDIYLPEYKMGIEFHGLYWHCDLIKSEKYHKEKYLFFKERGIELIQIFENEWLHKQDIVKSILSAKLGFITNKIFARKCEIREIDNQTYKEFCELNHIQGYGIAKVRLGLFYNDELVQLASFSKPRFNKNYDWENIRSCTKLNTTVVGGFSKLMKYFKTNYTGSIITYVDCRYFNGGGYLKNGFKFIKHTEPNYFYFKRNTTELETRNKYQKHKLKDILPIFDENMTEYENMLNNDYLRIFDAGNLIMLKNN
jgi:hypothetical protein